MSLLQEAKSASPTSSGCRRLRRWQQLLRQPQRKVSMRPPAHCKALVIDLRTLSPVLAPLSPMFTPDSLMSVLSILGPRPAAPMAAAAGPATAE